jgi:adenylate cyclase
LLGRYHKPSLEERMFLFLDLNSSTALAERLGTEKYSTFLKDFFSDLTEPLLKTKGEVYQYCGDEVVVVWKVDTALKNKNILKFFFMVEQMIQKRKDFYIKRYGVVPEFKAAIHYGEILVTEVGDLKREIVFHGDLINTTSRIISKCNTLGRRLLVSEDLMNMFKDCKECITEDLGIIPLRGKVKEIRLFSLDLTGETKGALC